MNSLAEANKRLRYYRIQQLYRELESYKLSTEFIEQVLCQFFTVGPATIYMALKHDDIKDVHYEWLELDKEWAASVVKIVQSKAYRAAKKARLSDDKKQLNLEL